MPRKSAASTSSIGLYLDTCQNIGLNLDPCQNRDFSTEKGDACFESIREGTNKGKT